MKPRLVIWGASGHASVVADAARLQNEYEVAGFLDDVDPNPGREFCGAAVLGGREKLDELHREGVTHIILGFGDCEARVMLAEVAREKGLCLATVVHPSAVVAADAGIGAGSVVAAGAVVNTGAVVGENVIVNTCASVDHHCVVGDGAHICPGVRLAGNVGVGAGSWVGIGATVVDRVRIGAGVVVGAGSVVVGDVADGLVAYGVPAREIRKVGSNAR